VCPNLSLITHIKQPLRKWVEAEMYGVRMLRQVDLAGAHDALNTASRTWRPRSFVAGLSVRRCLERASGMGACAVSSGQLRDNHPDTRSMRE